MRIAVTQPPASPDPRRNGEVTRRLMRQAAAQVVRLLVLPEGHLSGYAKEQVANFAAVDWPAVHRESTLVCELAAELGLWVVLGSAHPLTAPHRPHNSVYVISDEGQVVRRYDKRFCSHTELCDYYTPGTEPVVFDAGGYRFGIAVCIEISFPHLFSQYVDLGVDCLLLPTYLRWTPSSGSRHRRWPPSTPCGWPSARSSRLATWCPRRSSAPTAARSSASPRRRRWRRWTWTAPILDFRSH